MILTLDVNDGLEVEEDADAGVKPSGSETTNNASSSSSSSSSSAGSTGFTRTLKPSASAEASTDKVLTGIANYAEKYVQRWEGGKSLNVNDYEEDD